jgi:hypothetical protein
VTLNNTGSAPWQAATGIAQHQRRRYAQSGTTTITGGNVNFNAGTHAVSGTIAAGAGSSFKVGGATFNFGDGSALALADNLNFTSGAINLTGAGAGTTINAGSTLTLSGQSFGGSGKLTNQGTFNAATTTLGGVLVNEGTFNVSSRQCDGVRGHDLIVRHHDGRRLGAPLMSPAPGWIGKAVRLPVPALTI